MRFSRFKWDGRDPAGLAAELRALQPPLADVADDVAAIISEVESDGDAAIMRLEKKLGGVEPESIAVAGGELAAAPEAIEAEVAEAIRLAIDNVHRVAVAEAVASYPDTPFEDDHRITLRDVAVASAGAYVPGGAAAYPSSAVMSCVPAKVAGVERVAVASPPGPDGRVHPLVLAACALAGADEVYAIGGAQAIAALALGTESVWRVDMVVGPGNRYVQEAKRQLHGRVGIDGIAGPSELMVVTDAGAELRPLGLDLCAQAEHGEDGLLVACATEPGVLARLQELMEEVARERSIADAPVALVTATSAEAAIELANALAPEHLELDCATADELAESVRYAGCVFVGSRSATAFGDYVAGSNHILPTGGAGRFTGPLGPQAFRRRLATVQITKAAAEKLAPAVATLADAEGFPVHGESAQARVDERGGE